MLFFHWSIFIQLIKLLWTTHCGTHAKSSHLLWSWLANYKQVSPKALRTDPKPFTFTSSLPKSRYWKPKSKRRISTVKFYSYLVLGRWSSSDSLTSSLTADSWNSESFESSLLTLKVKRECYCQASNITYLLTTPPTAQAQQAPSKFISDKMGPIKRTRKRQEEGKGCRVEKLVVSWEMVYHIKTTRGLLCFVLFQKYCLGANDRIISKSVTCHRPWARRTQQGTLQNFRKRKYYLVLKRSFCFKYFRCHFTTKSQFMRTALTD